MGYDCTLHLIDPRSIERFVSWFLREPVDATAFEAAFDTDGLREEVLEKLAQDPSSGGRALLHSLLMFCSSEAPHQYSRGFCLGLWDKLGLGLADELPDDLVSSASLAPSLARIAERYPAFEHNLYTGIDGNYALGYFVPPEKVAAVRAYVETVVDVVKGEWLPSVERLLAVLTAAESRGLAYWEATDLEVVDANRAWLEPLVKDDGPASKTGASRAAPKAKAAKAAEVKRIELGAQFVYLAREIDGVVYAHSLSDSKTWLFDVRSGDPRAHTLVGPVFSTVVHRADGAVLAAGMIPRQGDLLAELSPETREYRTIERPAGVKSIRELVRVGDRVIAVCQLAAQAGLVWLDDQSPVVLPKASVYDVAVFDWGDSTAYVNVLGASYRLRANTLEPLPGIPPLTCYTLGDARDELLTRDGQILLSAAEKLSNDEHQRRRSAGEELPQPRLVLLSRDGTLTEVIPSLSAANSAYPARDGAVIVWQTEPVERDALKVYWHERREVASIPHALLGEKRGHCQCAMYCAALDELWVSFNSHIARVPWKVIDALPRKTVDEYTASKSALVAERARKEHERLWAKIRAKQDVREFGDPDLYLRSDVIVDVAGRGRAIVRNVDFRNARVTVELEDRTTLELPLPARP